MVNEKPLTAREIGKKLLDILETLLKTGNWEASLFLKASANRLRELKVEAARLARIEETKDALTNVAVLQKALPPGYLQVYISLYQVDSANLLTWHRTIKSLVEHSVTRPVYRNEAFVQEFVRSKTDIDHHGYAIVQINTNDILKIEPAPIDPFGHELLVLRENAVKVENIVGFVYANKKRYWFKENNLVFVDEIKE